VPDAISLDSPPLPGLPADYPASYPAARPAAGVPDPTRWIRPAGRRWRRHPAPASPAPPRGVAFPSFLCAPLPWRLTPFSPPPADFRRACATRRLSLRLVRNGTEGARGAVRCRASPHASAEVRHAV